MKTKMTKSTDETPLMQQHKAIKQKYPDAILLFRVGDFYETLARQLLLISPVFRTMHSTLICTNW